MNIILRWAAKEQPLLVRVIAMVFAGILFIFLIPYVLIIAIPKLDALLHSPFFFFGPVNFLVGGIMLISGLFFAWWSIGMQLFKANGTPLPMIPTQKLLISGPFRYCRNPMTFGKICALWRCRCGCRIVSFPVHSCTLWGIVDILPQTN